MQSTTRRLWLSQCVGIAVLGDIAAAQQHAHEAAQSSTPPSFQTLDPATELGPIASSRQLDRVLAAGGELVRSWQAADRERRDGTAAATASGGPVDEMDLRRDRCAGKPIVGALGRCKPQRRCTQAGIRGPAKRPASR